MKVRCPRCNSYVEWFPRPTQQEDEDTLGPFTEIPDYVKGGRLSPPDQDGKTWLLVKRPAEKPPSFWPAEIDCLRCKPVRAFEAAQWNAYMNRPKEVAVMIDAKASQA